MPGAAHEIRAGLRHLGVRDALGGDQTNDDFVLADAYLLRHEGIGGHETFQFVLHRAPGARFSRNLKKRPPERNRDGGQQDHDHDDPPAQLAAGGQHPRDRPMRQQPRQRLVIPRRGHGLPNFFGVQTDQKEDKKRAGHDGDKVGQEKQTPSAHDRQVEAAAQTETHGAERRHQRYGNGDSGEGGYGFASSAANHHRAR